jgi:hypothetical protein
VGFLVGGSQIYPQQTGTYLVTFSIQFARTSGGTNTHAEAWLRIDGVNVPDTSTRVLLPSGGNGEAVMTVPFSIDISFGSYLEVVMGTPDYTNTIAQAFPARPVNGTNCFNEVNKPPSSSLNLMRIAQFCCLKEIKVFSPSTDCWGL